MLGRSQVIARTATLSRRGVIGSVFKGFERQQVSGLHASSSALLAKVLASDAIEPVCASTFKSRGHELVEKPGIKPADLIKIIGEYEGLVVRSGTKVTKEIIEAGVNLKVIGRAGTGVDNIDVKAATSKGILVVNTPGGNTVSTAELAVSHILALARRIPQATASVKAGKWERSKFSGVELTGKTLGVIGMGRIGREVGTKLQAFGMNVVCYDPILSEKATLGYGFQPVSLETLFETSHFITVHTPLTKETKNLINAANLSKCMKGVRVVNCARGGIINEADLLEALKSGQVGGAALDTFEVEPPDESSQELRMHPNVVVTPHLGASTFDAQERVARQIAENMSDIFNGGAYVGVVNAPDLGVLKSHPQLLPYLNLAERIGSMQAQLLGNNKIGSISINLRGAEVSDSKFVDVFKAAVLKGALSELQDRTSISLVNASAIAENMGLVVNVNTSSNNTGASGYLNDISVDMEMEGFLNMSRTVRGTVFGSDDVRITEIDGYSVDLPSGDHVLLFNNVDRPGVLRKIADKLFHHNINIGHFSLGRKGLPGSKAMGAITIDSPAPAEIVKELNKSHDVSNMVQLDLTSASEAAFRIRSSGETGGVNKPTKKPKNPEFSSGPCKKRPGYSLANLRVDVLGRSHRSKLGKARLKRAIEDTKRILGVPENYLCGIVPASDTGAFEMAMWAMLGPRPVDSCHWESFGKGWKEDAVKHLKLKEVREFTADYGKLPDLKQTNPDHDIMFTFNGTTSGVRVPDLNWISDDRKGLTFNDATSAAFAMQIDWKKVDVTTFSWQKVLGGEGAHGVLILSPRAVERLETFIPDRPLPKIFRMTKKDKDGKIKVEKGIFSGDTINTPSMICVEDYIDALEWADSIGGLDGLIQRSKNNMAVLERFVSENNWIHFLAQDPAVRSSTSVCLALDLTSAQVKKFVELLDKEGVAYDVGSYRDAPDGLRIWCGATVETEDLEALMPWLQWAYAAVQTEK